MKTLTLALTILLLTSGWSCAQSTSEDIKNIRAMYKDIRDHYETYDTTAAEVWDESTEGGEVIGYYDDGDLKLMEVWLYGETRRSKTEYYYNNGQLFFVFDVDYKYNRPIYWDEETAAQNNDTEAFDDDKTVILENRYYFKDEQLIRWIKHNKEKVDSDDEDYKTKESFIPKFAEKMEGKLVR